MDLNRAAVFVRVVDEGGFTAAAPGPAPAQVLGQPIGRAAGGGTGRAAAAAVDAQAAPDRGRVGVLRARLARAGRCAGGGRGGGRSAGAAARSDPASPPRWTRACGCWRRWWPGSSPTTRRCTSSSMLTGAVGGSGGRGLRLRPAGRAAGGFARWSPAGCTAVALGLYAAPGYLQRQGTPTTVADLANHDCVMFRPDRGRARWTLDRAGGRADAGRARPGAAPTTSRSCSGWCRGRGHRPAAGVPVPGGRRRWASWCGCCPTHAAPAQHVPPGVSVGPLSAPAGGGVPRLPHRRTRRPAQESGSQRLGSGSHPMALVPTYKKKSGSPLRVLLILLLVAAVGGGLLPAAGAAPAGARPAAAHRQPPAIGRKTVVTVKAREPVRGLARVAVTADGAGLSDKLLAEASCRADSAGRARTASGDHVLHLDLGKLTTPEIKPGTVTVQVRGAGARHPAAPAAAGDRQHDAAGAPGSRRRWRRPPSSCTRPRAGPRWWCTRWGRRRSNTACSVGDWFFPGYPLPGGPRQPALRPVRRALRSGGGRGGGPRADPAGGRGRAGQPVAAPSSSTSTSGGRCARTPSS